MFAQIMSVFHAREKGILLLLLIFHYVVLVWIYGIKIILEPLFAPLPVILVLAFTAILFEDQLTILFKEENK